MLSTLINTKKVTFYFNTILAVCYLQHVAPGKMQFKGNNIIKVLKTTLYELSMLLEEGAP